MTTPLAIATLMIQLCMTQQAMDRIAVMTSLPSAAPPLVMQVGRELEKGWITGRSGRYIGKRAEWYVHNFSDDSGTVFVTRGNEHLCVHGIVHRLQMLAGVNPLTWEAERAAIGVYREYWRIYPPKLDAK